MSHSRFFNACAGFALVATAACGVTEPKSNSELDDYVVQATSDKRVYSLATDSGAQPHLYNRGKRVVYLPMNEYVYVQRLDHGTWSEGRPWFAVDGISATLKLQPGDTLDGAYNRMSFAYIDRQPGTYRFAYVVSADSLGRTILADSLTMSPAFEVQP